MSTSGPALLPPSRAAGPGWYPAPRELRWWDGTSWTEHRAAAPVRALVPGRPRTSGVEIAASWMLTVLTLGYLFPWAVAATRGARNSPVVAVVNLLLGWTLVGWLVALVMACVGRTSPYRAAPVALTPLAAPALTTTPAYAAPLALPPAPAPRSEAPPTTLPLPVDLDDTAPLYGLRDRER